VGLNLRTTGISVVRHFVDSSTCTRLLRRINQYRQQETLPLIYHESGERPLNYSVIDGDRISRDLPELLELFRSVTSFIKSTADKHIEPLNDMRVACNVNITPRGGTYRYHYDRNAVTAILYLNETDGGETECYPNYRLDFLKTRYPRLQERFDKLLQHRVLRRLSCKETLVRPESGKLLIMRGNRCLHSVRPVRGEGERVNIVMAYDYPNARFEVSDELNSYLYEGARLRVADPNYVLSTR
jgi:hypothetical protein